MKMKLESLVFHLIYNFNCLILPILLYGCEIWGFEKITQIEAFFTTLNIVKVSLVFIRGPLIAWSTVNWESINWSILSQVVCLCFGIGYSSWETG